MPDLSANTLTLADLDGLNYTILVPYNGTVPTGGDSLTEDLNLFYTVRAISIYGRAVEGADMTI